MDNFAAAKGEIIACAHAGKSAALNAALARVKATIAVRIDADVVISRNAFRCLPRWFRDPTVGDVGGATFPRMARSWLHRMRLIECIFGYLFVRPSLVAIDALPCVPGTFQAFRPVPARAVGGMVMGMNGEDADLTLQLGRLGYRAVLDRDIVIHEDVPTTLSGYREQRTRWYRSGAHLFARHNPLQGTSAGPRVWLSGMRAVIFRFMMLVRPIVYLYAAVLAIEQPTWSRNLWYVFVLFGSAVLPHAAVHRGRGRAQRVRPLPPVVSALVSDLRPAAPPDHDRELPHPPNPPGQRPLVGSGDPGLPGAARRCGGLAGGPCSPPWPSPSPRCGSAASPSSSQSPPSIAVPTPTPPSSGAPSRHPRIWLMTAQALQEMSHYGEVSTWLAGDQLLELLSAGGQSTLLPGASGVLSFRSDADFAAALHSGPLGPPVGAALLDLEHWSYTPQDEQADPSRYEAEFVDQARSAGLQPILAPGMDLVQALQSSSGSAADAYLSLGIATGAARALGGGDGYVELQSQSTERDSVPVRQLREQRPPAGHRCRSLGDGARRAEHQSVGGTGGHRRAGRGRGGDRPDGERLLARTCPIPDPHAPAAVRRIRRWVPRC